MLETHKERKQSSEASPGKHSSKLLFPGEKRPFPGGQHPGQPTQAGCGRSPAPARLQLCLPSPHMGAVPAAALPLPQSTAVAAVAVTFPHPRVPQEGRGEGHHNKLQ